MARIGIRRQDLNRTLQLLLLNCEMTLLKAYTEMVETGETVSEPKGAAALTRSATIDKHVAQQTLNEELAHRPHLFFARLKM